MTDEDHERERQRAMHEAIGWLCGALASKHPGFLENEVRIATKSGNTRIAGMLSSWVAPANRAVR